MRRAFGNGWRNEVKGNGDDNGDGRERRGVEAEDVHGHGERANGAGRHTDNDDDNGQDVEAALELLRGCLNTDPERRWDIGDVLACRWFRGCGEPS